MSANEFSLASPPHSPDSPTDTPACTDSGDTEMTCLLTSIQEEISRSRSSSPKKTMSNHYSRDRSERSGSARPTTNGRSSIGHGGMTPHYRHDDHMGGYYHPQPPPAPYDGAYGGGYDPYHPQMVNHTYQAPPRNRGNSVMTGDGGGSVPMSAVVPGTAFVNSQQLDVAYAYGIQREDGSYTRLIRADELSEINNIPRGQGPEGLIILPSPRQMDPALRVGPEPMVPRDVVQALPGNRRGYNQTPYGRSSQSDTTQEQIDAIVAAHPVGPVLPVASHAPPVRRREKIYCDKWIHEGTCAFTQMGCKYRHEMPMDRETQLSLGLNHGLPNWYRREYGVSMQSPAGPPALPGPQSNRLDGPWRRLESTQAEPGYTSPGSSMHAPGNSTPSMRPAYGPIAPPPGQSGSAFSNNPFAALKIEERDEDDEDEVTWRGRGGPQGPNNHLPQPQQ